MNSLYLNNFPIINLYKNPSIKSEVVTQMIFGEGFKIINKSARWLKIKIKEDKYIGYIKNKKFFFTLDPHIKFQ